MTSSHPKIFWRLFQEYAELTHNHVSKTKFITLLEDIAIPDYEAEVLFQKAIENGHICHCCGNYYGVNN